MPKSKVARRVGDKLTGSWRFDVETVAKSWASSSDVLDKLIGEEILYILDEYGDDPDWLDWDTHGRGTVAHVTDMALDVLRRGLNERLNSFEDQVVRRRGR